MNLELLTLDGYGIFVWPAFIFTFASCFILYRYSKKELAKQEEIFFKKFKELNVENAKTSENKEITKEALSGSLI